MNEGEQAGSSEFSGQHTEPIPGSMGDPKAKRPDPAPSGLPYAGAVSLAERERLANQNVLLDFVSHAPTAENKSRWLVGRAPKHATVWLNETGARMCDCPDLPKGRAVESDYKCEHIISVALWKAEKKGAANPNV